MVGKVVDDDDDLVEMSIIIAHGGPSSSRFLDAYPKRYSLKIPSFLL
ncbi:hypothetical protein COLO4_14827 [Corchorus olitorius]|uniref:Uncharacterized protein n=1 Tax=Corchorus olitorius TaxID=93759 RepID=A0A1R3JQM5_9ROSI|nr:hypothetical protein COLO4_14827 [Corchorus olitorius]